MTVTMTLHEWGRLKRQLSSIDQSYQPEATAFRLAIEGLVNQANASFDIKEEGTPS